MNVLKNMEAIFLVCATLILVTSVASAAAPAAPASRAYIGAALVDGVAMPVVHVVGKRRAA